MIGGDLIHGYQGTPLDPFITPAGPLPEPKLCNAKTKVCKAKKDKIAMPKTKLCNAKKQTLQCKTRDVALQILFVAVQNFNFRPQKLCNATEKHCNARNMNPRSCILPREMHYWAKGCSAKKKVCGARKQTLHCNVWFLRRSFRVKTKVVAVHFSAKQTPSAEATSPALATRGHTPREIPRGSRSLERPEGSPGNHESAHPSNHGSLGGPGGLQRGPEGPGGGAQTFQNEKAQKHCNAKKHGFSKPPSSKTPFPEFLTAA